MKKLLCCMILLISVTILVAQERGRSGTNDKKKKTGPRAIVYGGINFPYITGADSWEFGLIGPNIGIETNIFSLSDKAGANAELQFSGQGSKWQESTLEGKVVTSYLNLPLTVRVSGSSGIYGEAGLQPGILLSAKDKYSGNSIDFKDELNSFDLGIPLGVGYRKNKFGAGVRVVPGILNIIKDDTVDESWRNLIISVRASYVIL